MPTAERKNQRRATYVTSIRKIMFVDDQFPSIRSVRAERRETERAVQLAKHFYELGVCCEFENDSSWNESLQTRLTSADVAVIDYEMGGDGTACQTIIDKLSRLELSSIIVVFTAQDNPTDVLINLAIGCCDQVQIDPLDMLDAAPEMPAHEDFTAAFTSGQSKTVDDYLLFESKQKRTFSTFDAALNLFHINGLFVCVVKKPHQESESARILMEGFESAIHAWNPSPFTSLVSFARTRVREGWTIRDFERHSYVEVGLERYLMSSLDKGDQRRRATEITRRLIETRFSKIVDELSHDLTSIIPIQKSKPAKLPLTEDQISAVLHANSFFMSGAFSGTRLTLGTVFEMAGAYYVVASPACDMERPAVPALVPQPTQSADKRSLLQFIAVLLQDIKGSNDETTEAKLSRELAAITENRLVFFVDGDAPCARLLRTDALSKPKIFTLFAEQMGEITNSIGTVIRVGGGADGGNSFLHMTSKIRVVAQIRSPYAEHVTHLVGANLSRVGMDFIKP